MSTEEMSLEDLFCAVDDFCRLFLPDWHRQQLQYGERKRRRGCRMVLSEIMTILIHFHQSHYRDFKAFYLLHVCRHLAGAFPQRLGRIQQLGEDSQGRILLTWHHL